MKGREGGGGGQPLLHRARMSILYIHVALISDLPFPGPLPTHTKMKNFVLTYTVPAPSGHSKKDCSEDGRELSEYLFKRVPPGCEWKKTASLNKSKDSLGNKIYSGSCGVSSREKKIPSIGGT